MKIPLDNIEFIIRKGAMYTTIEASYRVSAQIFSEEIGKYSINMLEYSNEIARIA